MDFDHFDTAPDAWRACDEPMVEHVARAAPVRADAPLPRAARAPRAYTWRDVAEVEALRWLLPAKTAPPALIF